MNTRVVPSRGIGGAAGFCVFRLWAHEGPAASALATFPPSFSFLHVDNVVVRREDTSRTRIQVVEPLVWDLGVAQLLNCVTAAALCSSKIAWP